MDLQAEESFSIAGAGCYTVQSVGREHKHTLAHTGLMLWDAGLPFANYLAESPGLMNGESREA